MANDSLWIDYNKIFSFNAFINMIVTERRLSEKLMEFLNLLLMTF